MDKEVRILRKKGVSPVIATVLLVGMVIVIGIIIFLWFRSFTQESAVKFDKNIQLVCRDVVFAADWVDGGGGNGRMYISNDGNVPIFNLKVREDLGDGNYMTEEIEDFEGLNVGGSWDGEYYPDNNAEKLLLIPVLLGESENQGEVIYLCDETAGVEIFM